MMKRLEEYFLRPENKGRLLRLFWYVSLGMIVLGWVFIFLFWRYDL